MRRYRGVVIANGHLWNPRTPEYPGEFDGTTVHSANYKTPDLLRGKRVLVVGIRHRLRHRRRIDPACGADVSQYAARLLFLSQ